MREYWLILYMFLLPLLFSTNVAIQCHMYMYIDIYIYNIYTPLYISIRIYI